MIIKKYPETLPDLDIWNNQHPYGLGLIINTPDRWVNYQVGSGYIRIAADRNNQEDSISAGDHYHVEFELSEHCMHLDSQEKDQIYLLFLNLKGSELLL